MILCWDAASKTKAYLIEKYDHTPLLTTTAVRVIDAGVGSAAAYTYYVYSICNDDTMSGSLTLTVK